MKLPEEFLDRMKGMLGEEYDAFVSSYAEPSEHGLRVNRLKLSAEEFRAISPVALEPIPWVRDGFFYKEGRPGKHPYHEAGLYYIQEPSAMAVGELVGAKPGERVLDLCAAPGGKTTHLAAGMQQQGLLLANEPHPARARILSQNVERMGIRNAVVTNEMPDRLAERFPAFFDRVLVDAPCSGEGMFRKDPEACEQWSPEHVTLCASRQQDILRHAAVMLKPGGVLVYSTCTFAPEENEGVISRFLQEEDQFELVEPPVHEGFGEGQPDWVAGEAADVEKTVRLWPHRLRGEGHYVAVLRKTDGETPPIKRPGEERLTDRKLLKEYEAFARESLTETPAGDFLLFGDQLYMLPDGMLSLRGLKVPRPGWHLGTVKKNRFEPSHALALSLKKGQAVRSWSLAPDSPEAQAYLRGESLAAEGPKGWCVVDVSGYPLGWGKLADGLLKNHFPKGLRWM